MGLYRALALAATSVVALSGMARAADLLPPPPPPAPEAYIAPSSGGWYLRGDVGVGDTYLSSLRPSFNAPVPGFQVNDASVGGGAFIDAGVGYQFNDWFRADVTEEYRADTAMRATESYTGTDANGPYTGFDHYGANISHALVMANGYVDLGTWSRVTPYLGAGVGMSYNTVSGLSDQGAGSTSALGTGNGGYGYAKTHSNTSLAWALMAGLDYTINPNLKMELGYRYLNMGATKSGVIACTIPAGCPNEVHRYNLASNDFHLGMLWTFGGYAQAQPAAWEPAPQEPIVKRF